MNIRRPNETLDDFKSRVTAPAEPPTEVLLYPTGDIEVLEPVAHVEEFVNAGPVTAAGEIVASPAKYPFSWFHRSLAFGGALAIIAFLGISLLSAIYRTPVEPVSPVDVASDQNTADKLAPSEQLDDSDLFSAVDSPFAFNGFPAARKASSPRRVSSRPFRNVHRPQIVQQQPRPVVPHPQLIVSEFVPTTLIIYIENGEIKTRIEPQLTASYKKPPPPGN